MSDIGALVEELIAAGTPPALAASVIARAIVIGKDAAPYRDDLPDTRSKAAIRQQQYRERKRNAGITKRNENITRDVTRDDVTRVTENVTKRNETITERNENVTPLRLENNDISYLLPSSENLEKKESKKDAVRRKRNAPLRDDWAPSLTSYRIAEQYGQNVQVVEQIFRDYLKSSGKLYADYDAAFNNFIRNQRNFGKAGNGTHNSASPNSLVGSIKRELEQLERSESFDPSLPDGPVQFLPRGSVRRP